MIYCGVVYPDALHHKTFTPSPSTITKSSCVNRSHCCSNCSDPPTRCSLPQDAPHQVHPLGLLPSASDQIFTRHSHQRLDSVRPYFPQPLFVVATSTIPHVPQPGDAVPSHAHTLPPSPLEEDRKDPSSSHPDPAPSQGRKGPIERSQSKKQSPFPHLTLRKTFNKPKLRGIIQNSRPVYLSKVKVVAQSKSRDVKTKYHVGPGTQKGHWVKTKEIWIKCRL